jgi:hypothetical protein
MRTVTEPVEIVGGLTPPQWRRLASLEKNDEERPCRIVRYRQYDAEVICPIVRFDDGEERQIWPNGLLRDLDWRVVR